MNRDQVLRTLKEHKPTLERRFGVTRLALFGSFAQAQATDSSNVGILVQFSSPPNWRTYYGAQFYLEDLLGRTVDLATDREIRHEFRPYVDSEVIHV